MKIIYIGLQAENYDPRRSPSFERVNFYGTLTAMPDVSAIEFPFDTIVSMGKREWNKQLLELVRREKPDLVFVFMFSDEFEPATLDEIKKMTTSVAWFADDQWRLWNYSRHWAPHFTTAVTTWSKAPAIYESYGITNIVHSQWAANAFAAMATRDGGNLDIDVSFVGQRNAARAGIIADLRRAGITVWVRGLGWPEGRISDDERAAAIARSKINLNLNTPPSRLNPRVLGRIFVRRSMERLLPDFHLIDNIMCWWHASTPQIKARPFEILARGAFLISPRADDMERYYGDKKEIVYYDGTTADLIAKIKYYLDDGAGRSAGQNAGRVAERIAEREKIARAGRERTLREHTYEKRFRNLFSLLHLS